MATHRVRAEERLSDIAALHGVSHQELLIANPEKPRTRLQSGAIVFATLAEGEELTLPGRLGAWSIGDKCGANAHVGQDMQCACDAGYNWAAATGLDCVVSGVPTGGSRALAGTGSHAGAVVGSLAGGVGGYFVGKTQKHQWWGVALGALAGGLLGRGFDS